MYWKVKGGNKTAMGKKDGAVSGLFWKFVERICAQGVSFVLSVILARLLMPEDYGTIALVLVFIDVANVFVSSGLGESLVQKKDSDDEDFSTIFFCNLGFTFILYGILFVAAPYIAGFYQNPLLTSVIRVLSIKLIITGVNSIQHAYVQKNMLFRRFFYSTIIGTVVSGIIGIIMAYHGFGVWALVTQYLVNSTMDTCVLAITVKWRPKFLFSVKAAKQLIGYGWKVMAASLLTVGYNKLRSLIIGKLYSTADLAFYNKGEQLPSLIVNNIDSSVNSVMLPVYAKCNDSVKRVHDKLRETIRLETFLLFPLLAGLAGAGERLISILLTEKWLPCVPYMMVLCVYYAYVPVSTASSTAIKAVGKSDVFLKSETFKRILYITVLLLSVKHGVMAIALTNIVTVIIGFIVAGFFLKKYLNYTFREQLSDIFPALTMSLSMTVVVYWIGKQSGNNILILMIQVATGIVLYIGFALLTRNHSLNVVSEYIKKIIHRKK